MRVLISEPIKKIAVDFSILRTLSGFAKNPEEAIKKFLIDSFKKGEFTLEAALGVVDKNVKTAGIPLKPIIISALILFGAIKGPQVVGAWLEKNLTEHVAPEISHQEDVKKIIQEK